MILQYFKKKENEYKKYADEIYIDIVNNSKKIVSENYFNKLNFDSSFEILSIILVFYLKTLKDINQIKFKKINEEIINNFTSDLDKTLREIGIGDMSIGKYVKKYVKKFYFRLKKIDLILANNQNDEFAKYLRNIKYIDESNVKQLSINLLDFYENLKKNRDFIE